MDHKLMKDKLFALYDGELESADRKEVETHISDCLECRELYERWTKTASVFFRVPKVVTSDFFVQSVMNRVHSLEEPSARTVSWNGLLNWLVPAISLVLVFLAVALPLPQTASVDAFLFQETNNRSSWIFANKAPTTDETLQLVMEG